MTKEEFEQLKSTVKQWLFHTGSLETTNYANELKVKFIEPREKRIADLEKQIEEMKKYIKACWVEENLNDYSSYITNSSDEFRDLVKELNDEIRNGR